MGMPTDIGVIDLMLGIPDPGKKERWYDFLKPNLRDAESATFKFPAQYMFKEVPEEPSEGDMIAYTLDQMDGHGIDKALIGVGLQGGIQDAAALEHPDRFLASVSVDPNEGMKAIHRIVEASQRYDLKAITLFPAGCNPGVPINDKRMYPVYAKACELDIPVLCCVGVPGPRVPMGPQKVELIDEVCWFFPELKFVMRHGAEPWTELAVKLMLKWPNLYYSTSAFSPRYYPDEIVRFANTRGANKVMYAGYFPMGLSLDRIFGELPSVGFNDDVWPKFLRENAVRVFGL
ncbi:MAG: amidohydrolase family protein [Actinobacteria bacterium]|nr:amidohydrolase family protein [Actinomycetota bacterium]